MGSTGPCREGHELALTALTAALASRFSPDAVMTRWPSVDACQRRFLVWACCCLAVLGRTRAWWPGMAWCWLLCSAGSSRLVRAGLTCGLRAGDRGPWAALCDWLRPGAGPGSACWVPARYGPPCCVVEGVVRTACSVLYSNLACASALVSTTPAVLVSCRWDGGASRPFTTCGLLARGLRDVMRGKGPAAGGDGGSGDACRPAFMPHLRSLRGLAWLLGECWWSHSVRHANSQYVPARRLRPV